MGGRDITFEEANHWLGERIKADSPLGRYSPLAWFYERGVSLVGRWAWRADGEGSPFCVVYRDSWLRRWKWTA